MTKSYAKYEILNYVNPLWGYEWKSMKAGKSARAFFPSVDSAKILNSNTLSFSTTTNQLLSGHCRSNAYQYRFKHVSSPFCSYRRRNNFSIHREPLISVLHLKLTWPPKLYVFALSRLLLQALNVFTVKTQRLNYPMTNAFDD